MKHQAVVGPLPTSILSIIYIFPNILINKYICSTIPCFIEIHIEYIPYIAEIFLSLSRIHHSNHL